MCKLLSDKLRKMVDVCNSNSRTIVFDLLFGSDYFIDFMISDENVYRNTFKQKTDLMESPQEAQPARENSSLGFIEAVHQW